LTRSSRIQVSRIAVYWAVLTFALALFWSVLLNMLQLTGIGPAASLAVPAALGGILAVYIYFFRVQQTLEYDDNGYSMSKGRKEGQKHSWSELRECSVIRDSYGRHKVRVYVERDGQHFDIDSKASGVDPFTLRDYILGRIKAKEASTSEPDVFDGLEREIQRGRANWIADLSETFRFYQVSGDIFPVMARGSTRPKGFLLSRFVAVTLMPNYEVALYAHEVGDSEGAKTRVTRLVRVIENLRDEKNIKWSWLLLFNDGAPPSSVASFIEEFGNKDVGIGCIDTSTGRITISKNQLGVSLAKQMRLNQLIRDLKKRRARRQTIQAG